MKVLKARLFDMKLQEEQQKYAAQRKSAVGSGDRSERIRTYNYPQSRVTDHRIGLTLQKLDQIMEGPIYVALRIFVVLLAISYQINVLSILSLPFHGFEFGISLKKLQ